MSLTKTLNRFFSRKGPKTVPGAEAEGAVSTASKSPSSSSDESKIKEGVMGNKFDENVAGKMPKTRELKSVPKRPWDVVKSAERNEPERGRARAEVREAAEPEIQHHEREDVLVASDDTLMIDNENLDVFEEIKQLEAQMVSTLSVKTGLEDEMEKARQTIEDLQAEAEDLEERVDTLRTKEELERQLTTVQGQRDSAMDRLGEVETRLESAITTRAAVQADLENTRESLEEALGENANLSERLDEVTLRNKEGDRELSRSVAENERLRDRVRQLEIIKETQDSNLQAARAAIKNIKQRLAESNVRARLHR